MNNTTTKEVTTDSNGDIVVRPVNWDNTLSMALDRFINELPPKFNYKLNNENEKLQNKTIRESDR